ncbi:hypothetical protein [Nocardia farcinica]|uniref:hypothetical protein n=1 Tax=Nocardia farcinica TaxID=37329 RepID=UPI002455B4D1|nr:hypothetical protein [Nocardia farcinica]
MSEHQPADADRTGDEIAALARRVQTARGKLPLQYDSALVEVLSDAEIAAERELAEWTRARRRAQRRRAVRAELAAEKRERRAAARIRRAEEADARWHRRALAARRRVANQDARLAQLYRRAEWSSRALIAVVVLGMVWAGVNVQRNLVPSGDMSDPLYWLSYGIEAMISIPIITIMIVATTAARWGRELPRGKVVFFEVALLGTTIALNTGPHLAAGDFGRAAEYAIAPAMVGVVIWLHAWVAARYAQLIDSVEVDEAPVSQPFPTGHVDPTAHPADTDMPRTATASVTGDRPAVAPPTDDALPADLYAAPLALLTGGLTDTDEQPRPARVRAARPPAPTVPATPAPRRRKPTATDRAPLLSTWVDGQTLRTVTTAPAPVIDRPTEGDLPPADSQPSPARRRTRESAARRRPAESQPAAPHTPDAPIPQPEPTPRRYPAVPEPGTSAQNPHQPQPANTAPALPRRAHEPAVPPEPSPEQLAFITEPDLAPTEPITPDPDPIAVEADDADAQIWAVARAIADHDHSPLPVDQIAEILTLADRSWSASAIATEVGADIIAVERTLHAGHRIGRAVAAID